MPLPAYERRTRNHCAGYEAPRNPDWRAESLMNAKNNWSYQEGHNRSVAVPGYAKGFTNARQIIALMRKNYTAIVDGTKAVLRNETGRECNCSYTVVQSLYQNRQIELVAQSGHVMYYVAKT